MTGCLPDSVAFRFIRKRALTANFELYLHFFIQVKMFCFADADLDLLLWPSRRSSTTSRSRLLNSFNCVMEMIILQAGF